MMGLSDTRLQPRESIMAHKEALGQDAEGRYRRYIGWKYGNNKMVQHLFRLGKDRGEAEKRNMRLEALWRYVEQRWRDLRERLLTNDPIPVWDEITLQMGQAVARGETVVRLSVSAEIRSSFESYPSAAVLWLQSLQRAFPCVSLQIEDADLYERGVDAQREYAQHLLEQAQRAQAKAQEALGSVGEPLSGQRLH